MDLRTQRLIAKQDVRKQFVETAAHKTIAFVTCCFLMKPVEFACFMLRLDKTIQLNCHKALNDNLKTLIIN